MEYKIEKYLEEGLLLLSKLISFKIYIRICKKGWVFSFK